MLSFVYALRRAIAEAQAHENFLNFIVSFYYAYSQF
jgi:hypothetical protein